MKLLTRVTSVSNCKKVMVDVCERNVVKYELITHYL